MCLQGWPASAAGRGEDLPYRGSISTGRRRSTSHSGSECPTNSQACLLRVAHTHYEVVEFGIVPRHRRQGIGSVAVAKLRAYCRASGRHRALEARVLRLNSAALALWLAQGFVTEADGVDDVRLGHRVDPTHDLSDHRV